MITAMARKAKIQCTGTKAKLIPMPHRPVYNECARVNTGRLSPPGGPHASAAAKTRSDRALPVTKVGGPG